MKEKVVRELMIPAGEYSTVSEGATLFDAVMALEKAVTESDRARFPHKELLVYDKDDNTPLTHNDVYRNLKIILNNFKR